MTGVARNHSVGTSARVSSTASSRSGRRPRSAPTARPGRRHSRTAGADSGRAVRRPPVGHGADGASPTAPPPGHRRRRHRRHHRHRRRRHPIPTSPPTSTPRCRRNFTMDIPAHRRAVRGARPASTRPTSTRAVTAPTSPASSPPTTTASARRRGPRRHDRQRARRAGLGLLLPVRDGRRAHLRGDAGLDVVNMSFYTDPWLYNCDSADDYLVGPVTEDELAEQALTKQTITAALEYAHDAGVTLVGRGRQRAHRPVRCRPGSTPRAPTTRRGTEVDPHRHQRLPGPAERGPARHRGRLGRAVAAPSPTSRTTAWAASTSRRRAAGSVTSSARRSSDAGQHGPVVVPAADRHRRGPGRRGRRSPRRLQPARVRPPGRELRRLHLPAGHVDGVAARRRPRRAGHRGARPGQRRRGYSLAPDTVRSLIERPPPTTPARPAASRIYTDEGRPADWNAACAGTTADNGLYGEGIVNAAAAVSRRGR